MSKNYLFIVILFVIFLIIISFTFINKLTKNQNTQTPTSSETVTFNKLKKQINNDGQVTISITPYQSTNTGAWKFEIILSTHSVELNYDLNKIAVLIANEKEYQPISWNGDPPGGHHRKGILEFPPITPQPQSITLKLFQINGIKERIFYWDIK